MLFVVDQGAISLLIVVGASLIKEYTIFLEICWLPSYVRMDMIGWLQVTLGEAEWLRWVKWDS